MIALTRSRQLILMSIFSIPMMVAVGAVGHLVSLDASAAQPLLALEQAEPLLSLPLSVPEASPVQTDSERQNVARTQLQEGDWLVKQGNFKAAKKVYQDLLDRSSDLGSDADLKDLVTQRLEKLEQSIVAAQIKDKQVKDKQLQDKQLQDKLKAAAKKKSTLKPAVKPTVKAVALTAIPAAPLSVSSPEQLNAPPIELTPRNATPTSAIDLTGTDHANIRFELQSDLTTESGEPVFERESDRVTPRLVPNSDAE